MVVHQKQESIAPLTCPTKLKSNCLILFHRRLGLGGHGCDAESLLSVSTRARSVTSRRLTFTSALGFLLDNIPSAEPVGRPRFPPDSMGFSSSLS